jgi:hypothetical protein
VDVCGPVVRYMRQVKSGVSHTGNRFSEPVAIACRHFLRTVSSRHATFGVTYKCAPHVLTYASKAKGVDEVVPEGMKNLHMVVYAMCANVPAEPLGAILSPSTFACSATKRKKPASISCR